MTLKKPTAPRVEIEHAAEIARTLIAEQAAANVKILANAVQEATKLIASANESAVKLLASNAAESAKVLSVRGTDDHDLIVGLKTEFTIEMKGLKADIKDLKDGTTAKIEKHDSQIIELEKWQVSLNGKEGAPERLNALDRARSNQNVWMAGIAAALTILIGLLVFHILKI